MLCELPVKSAAGSIAFISVVLTNVVVSATPFQTIAVEGRNPIPVRSSTVSTDPASRLAGLILLIAGAELFTAKSTAGGYAASGGGLPH